MSRSVTGRLSSGSMTPSSAFRIASRSGFIPPPRVALCRHAPVRDNDGMTWFGLVRKNLFRRPARTLLTAAGVSLGVALIVALLSITQGVHRTAGDLIHIGRADFGVFQSD